MPKFVLRKAEPEDTSLVLSFIRQLAEYEKMTDEVQADEKTLYQSLFVQKIAHALIAEEDGKAIGFALYFYNFSTFVGRPGLYLEDIYIQPEYRKKGYGTIIFQRLANIALEEGCGRMEWTCLDWNEPSRQFYRKMGAVTMDEWTVHRFTEETIRKIAAGNL
jgi:GNAT superfamily N-acetyltransferase